MELAELLETTSTLLFILSHYVYLKLKLKEISMQT